MSRFALFIIAAGIIAGTAQAAEIHLRRTAHPAGKSVRLGDVAMVYRTDAERAKTLRAIELFRAPRGGASRTWSIRDVQNALARRGVKLTAHRFSGSSQVVVGTPRAGTVATQSAATSNRDSDQQQLNEPMVVVAARALERGMLLTQFDVRQVPASSLAARMSRQKVIRSVEMVVGMEVTRNLRQGSVLTENVVRRPILVRRGKPVQVTVYSGGIYIRTRAVAESDGAMGDLISCRSTLDRKKRFFVRVTGREEVTVFARSASAR